jgi:hypothetical protein
MPSNRLPFVVGLGAGELKGDLTLIPFCERTLSIDGKKDHPYIYRFLVFEVLRRSTVY